MIKAYKYKLKPNSTQEIALNQFLGSARFIYNWGLRKKKDAWENEKKNIVERYIIITGININIAALNNFC